MYTCIYIHVGEILLFTIYYVVPNSMEFLFFLLWKCPFIFLSIWRFWQCEEQCNEHNPKVKNSAKKGNGKKSNKGILKPKKIRVTDADECKSN